MPRLFSPAGGLLYHARALRYRNSLWAPFRQQVALAFDDWHPPEKELIVLGPSGGYTLPSDFLERFEKILLFDPDPLAPLFFQRSHPPLPVLWSKEDLIFENKRFSPERLSSAIETHPHAAVLFANLLGQLPLLHPDLEALKAWWTGIQPSLQNRSWMTYHDLFSFEWKGDLPARWPEGEVLPQIVRIANEKRRALELVDHGTSELFDRSLANWTWKISPRRSHVVGAVYHRRT